MRQIVFIFQIRWSKCPELIKNFYSEHQDVTNMTSDQVRALKNIFLKFGFEAKSKYRLPKKSTIAKISSSLDISSQTVFNS